MKSIPHMLTALFLCFSGSIISLRAQLPELTRDPSLAIFVYDDVNNFIHAFNLLGPGADTLTVLQQEYLDKGTPGLKAFIEKYDLDAVKLADAIDRFPEDYTALPEKLTWLQQQQDSIIFSFKKLKSFIPDAVFAPTYYLIGSGRGIGAASVEGPLITIEKNAHTVVNEKLKTLVVHEHMHINQAISIGSVEEYRAIYDSGRSLLAFCIREGMAEFFTEMVTGKYVQENAREFVYKNEKRLWNQFKDEMYETDPKEWMWSTPTNPEQPRDIGYVFGALIVEYYYKRSTDVNEAVPYLLSLTNYDEFMKRCQYENKFSE